MIPTMWMITLLPLIGAPILAQEAPQAPAGPSTAQSSPDPPALTLRENPSRNFLVRLVDEDGLYRGQDLVFTLGEEDQAVSVSLLDDGQSPDTTPDDDHSTAAITTTHQHPTLAVVSLPSGESLWEDPAFALPPELEKPLLILNVTPDGMTHQLTSSDQLLPAPPRPGPFTARLLDLAVSLGPPVLTGLTCGCLLGVLVPLRRRRRRQQRALAPRSPLTWPAGVISQDGTPAQSWQVPDAEARFALLVALARHAIQAGPVLVVPSRDTRPALAAALTGLPTALVPARDQASPEGLARAAASLGEGLVLVAGPEALETPDPDEAPDAALAEFLTLCRLPTLVLLLPDEASPAPPQVTLVRQGKRLFAGPQTVLDGQELVLSG